MKSYWSVQWKILLPMIIIFLLILIIISSFSASQQKSRLLDLTEHQVVDVLNGYLDSLNAMMMTGTMANREILKQKLESRVGIKEARVIRADAVSSIYGEGFKHEAAQDDWDRRALTGEKIMDVRIVNGERLLTVIEPFIAVKERNGTNCLTCHVVPEGTILGAGRITYSLADMDKAIHHDLLFNAVVNFSVLILGLIVISFIMKKVMISPLNYLALTMGKIGKHSDLRPRLILGANDEFRQVNRTINQMLDKFQPIILDLVKSMNGLSISSSELTRITQATRDGANEQKSEAGALSAAIDELLSSTQHVANNAVKAKEEAIAARSEAHAGSVKVMAVKESIGALEDQLEASAKAVQRLADGTQRIGQVSDTISKISEQTNLLALNAAIEAARAGEQGRGFAVVADEVRLLSHNTQKATAQIRTIIDELLSSSREAVSDMEKSVNITARSVNSSVEASTALNRIEAAVDAISEINSIIANAASRQTESVNDINKNIHTIRTVCEQTSEGSCRSLQESESLAEISARLEAAIKQFTV